VACIRTGLLTSTFRPTRFTGPYSPYWVWSLCSTGSFPTISARGNTASSFVHHMNKNWGTSDRCAHWPVVMTDLPVALLSATSVLLLIAALRRWTPLNLVLLAVSLGLTLAVKHSKVWKVSSKNAAKPWTKTATTLTPNREPGRPSRFFLAAKCSCW